MRVVTAETRRKLSEAGKGRVSPRKGVVLSKETRRKCSEAKKGDRHPNWKGGISSVYHRLAATAQWREWRIKVFERDDYRCIDCGDRGVYLEPHHILPIRKEEYREELFNLRNGITLCRQCHQKTFRKEEELARTYSSLIPNQV